MFVCSVRVFSIPLSVVLSVGGYSERCFVFTLGSESYNGVINRRNAVKCRQATQRKRKHLSATLKKRKFPPKVKVNHGTVLRFV